MKLGMISEAVMGSTEYKLPENVQQLMADFYLLQLLDHGLRRSESHRSDIIDREIEHVSSILLPGIKQHMLSYVAYSIAREARHLFDAARLKSLPARSPLFLTWVQEKYSFITGFVSNELASSMLSTIDMPRRIDDESSFYGLNIDKDVKSQIVMDTQRLSNGVGRITRQGTDREQTQIARAALKVFDPAVVEWSDDFGGPVWKDATTLWFKLANAKSENEITYAIDRIYQQQHNTGALLNKSPEYEGHWLNMMLNIKYEANDPDQLMPMASPYMRRLTGMVIADKKGRAYNRKYGEPGTVQQNMANRAVQAIRSDQEVSQAIRNLSVDHEGTLSFDFMSVGGNRYEARVYCNAHGRENHDPINYYELIAVRRNSAESSRISKRLISPEDLVTALKLAY